MPTPRLALFAFVALCLRSSVIGCDAPATTVSYDEFKRRQESQPGNVTLLTGIEAIAALHGDDWPRRWAAAESLGLSGNRSAVDALIAALTNDEDWRLNFVAAIALGRLGDPRAIPALTAVSESHWYPQVRSVGRKAIAVITGRDSYPEDRKLLTDYFHIGVLTPDYLDQTYLKQIHVAYAERPVLALRTGIGELSQAEIEQAQSRSATESSSQDHLRDPSKFRPACGLRVEGGVLLGHSYGEWGGNLVFVASPTDVRLLIDDNITGIHRLPCGIVAVAGCAHMGNRIAHLYLVTQSTDGTWSARKWRSLPAAPSRSGFLPDGRLYIECANRDDVIFSPDGRLAMAE